MRSLGSQDRKVWRSFGGKKLSAGNLKIRHDQSDLERSDLISRDLIKIFFKELFDNVKSALILKGVLSPMNSMFKLNCRYDIEMNEADLGVPLTNGLTWAVFFLNASVVPSSNFVDFIYCASRICLGQNVKALV